MLLHEKSVSRIRVLEFEIAGVSSCPMLRYQLVLNKNHVILIFGAFACAVEKMWLSKWPRLKRRLDDGEFTLAPGTACCIIDMSASWERIGPKCPNPFLVCEMVGILPSLEDTPAGTVKQLEPLIRYLLV